jgi:hypothetical protein
MESRRKGEIALTLLKRYLAKDLRLCDIAGLRREIGNIAKETGIPSDELREFAELILGEIVEEQFTALKKAPHVKVLD